MPERVGGRLPLAALLACLGALNLATLRDGHLWGDDFAQYLLQAGSILDGSTAQLLEASRYRHLHSDDPLYAPVLYPWGYPLLLSLVRSVFGDALAPMKIATHLFLLLSLPVVFALFRDRLGPGPALAVAAALGLNPTIFEFKNDLLSDLPFLFVSLLTLLALQRFVVGRGAEPPRAAGLALLGVLLFVALALRVAAVVLIATALVVQAVERVRGRAGRRRSASRADLVQALPYVVLASLAALLAAALPFELSSPLEITARVGPASVAHNAFSFLKLAVGFFSDRGGDLGKAVGAALLLASVPFVLSGLARDARRSYHYAVFCLLLLALHALFPATDGMRYLFPAMPFYFYYLHVGLAGRAWRLRAILRGRPVAVSARQGFVAVQLAVLLVATGARAAHAAAHRGEAVDGPYRADSRAMFAFVAANAAPDDVVVFRKPRAMTLFTGRRSILLRDPASLGRSPATFVVCTKGDRLDLALVAGAAALRPVHENDTFRVYRRQRAGAPPAPPTARGACARVGR